MAEKLRFTLEQGTIPIADRIVCSKNFRLIPEKIPRPVKTIEFEIPSDDTRRFAHRLIIYS